MNAKKSLNKNQSEIRSSSFVVLVVVLLRLRCCDGLKGGSLAAPRAPVLVARGGPPLASVFFLSRPPQFSLARAFPCNAQKTSKIFVWSPSVRRERGGRQEEGRGRSEPPPGLHLSLSATPNPCLSPLGIKLHFLHLPAMLPDSSRPPIPDVNGCYGTNMHAHPSTAGSPPPAILRSRLSRQINHTRQPPSSPPPHAKRSSLGPYSKGS